MTETEKLQYEALMEEVRHHEPTPEPVALDKRLGIRIEARPRLDGHKHHLSGHNHVPE